ncbi:MAG: S8 family serine peptidase [Chloroflexota bacterium]
MKRLTILISVVLIATMLVGVLNVSSAATGPQTGKSRLLVQFAPGKKGLVENALKGAGAEFHYAFDGLNAFAVSLPAAAVDGISRNPNVVLLEEDVARFPISVMPSTVQAPALAGSQVVPYGVDMVQARDVWDVNRDDVVDAGAPTGSNRKVCIIDSGIYTGHEDFQGLNVSGYDGNLPWDEDGSGHGSHVSGTIAAVNNTLGVIGVTPGTVNVYMVRVFGNDGLWAYSSTLIDAANRCAAAGANVISMSLGGSRSSVTERRGFDSLYAQGILSIAAAGNDGTTAYSYPASYDSVVSVAAIDAAMLVADFSQQNSQVELAAPGVGVLSTVPYLDINSLTVNGVDYAANHIEYAARGTASGALVSGGLCDSTGAWAGKVVLCERGVISFYDKVMNVQNSGGAAAVIYNNEPGNFLGTLGDGASSTIIALSLSQEDGQTLVANALGQTGTVSSEYVWPASGYEYYDGTSMATPHVSAVAALVWSADPTATNQEVRDALAATAYDLGAAGRDVAYGFGLVQAADAIAYLTGGGSTDPAIHVADLSGATALVSSKYWSATVTISIVDADGAPVSGAVVSGAWSGGYSGSASCTTNTSGLCSVTVSTIRTNKTYVTFTVSNVTATGYVYDPAANLETSITLYRP